MERKYSTEQCGARIKQRREELNLTQEELASRMGISRSHLQRIEAGDNFSITTLVSACNALEVSPEWICGSQEDLQAILDILQDCTPAETKAIITSIDSYKKILRDR